jgi:hypothetical protein
VLLVEGDESKAAESLAGNGMWCFRNGAAYTSDVDTWRGFHLGFLTCVMEENLPDSGRLDIKLRVVDLRRS